VTKPKTKTKRKPKPTTPKPTKPTKPTKATKPTKLEPAKPSAPAYRLRRSRVHGSGLFATRTIPSGAQIIEYVGERISHDEADRRHADKADDDGHTFLFTIDAKTVIDAGVGGNISRFINHSCDPNCEVILDDGRPFVESIRVIAPGEELAYDYNLTRSPDDSPEVAKIFACRCGAATCRGTMLAPVKKKKPKAPKKKTARR
jgi:SET domain-containing protein